jgi:protein TonB
VKKVEKAQEPVKEIKNEEPIFTVVEDMPKYPGGEEARNKYMVDNIKYPEGARKNGIQGRVFVSFVVEKDGAVTDVKVLRGIGGGCDEEAVRVIAAMPNWQPGKQDGKPVRVQFNMPISFNLDGKGEKEVKNSEVKDPPPPPKK